MSEVVSFGLFVFNHEKFVREAIEAVYAQTYRPLELIVSEDASTDGSRRIIDELSLQVPEGINIIKVYQDSNKGLAHAINAVAGHASGNVIVFAAGDDVSEANRVEATMAEFADPKVMFVHTAHSIIDENSRLLRGAEKDGSVKKSHTLSGYIKRRNPSVLGATCAYRREIFERFGELRAKVIQEDILLPFRALLLGEGCYLPHPLVRYRTHGGNVSFGGVDAGSAEMVRRIIRMQNNRLSLALNQTDDLALHLVKGGVVPDELTKQLAEDLVEAQAEARIASAKGNLIKTAHILQGLLTRKVRCAAAIKFFFIYVIPRGYAFALWLRKKQRSSP